MPDNANPTIHAPKAAPSRVKRRAAFLEDFNDTPWMAQNATASGLLNGDGGGDDGNDDDDDSDDGDDRIDAAEIFDLVRSITDPEHPLTLEQLAVVSQEQIKVTYPGGESSRGSPHVLLEFTPTIPHCSMATLIGLTLRVRLLRALPDRFKVDIRVKEGTHQSERSVNKQLNDKERVAAALENNHLLDVVQQCLATAGRRGKDA